MTANFCMSRARASVQTGTSWTIRPHRSASLGEHGLPVRARNRAAPRTLGRRPVRVRGDPGQPDRHRPDARTALARPAGAVHRRRLRRPAAGGRVGLGAWLYGPRTPHGRAPGRPNRRRCKRPASGPDRPGLPSWFCEVLYLAAAIRLALCGYTQRRSGSARGRAGPPGVALSRLRAGVTARIVRYDERQSAECGGQPAAAALPSPIWPSSPDSGRRGTWALGMTLLPLAALPLAFRHGPLAVIAETRPLRRRGVSSLLRIG